MASGAEVMQVVHSVVLQGVRKDLLTVLWSEELLGRLVESAPWKRGSPLTSTAAR